LNTLSSYSLHEIGLINSAWVQANQLPLYGLRKTKELGFDTVDFSSIR